MVFNCKVYMCVTFFGWIQCKIVAFENPDIRNHPRISSRIFTIVRSFGGRDGSEKINVRWGTTHFGSF